MLSWGGVPTLVQYVGGNAENCGKITNVSNCVANYMNLPCSLRFCSHLHCYFSCSATLYDGNQWLSTGPIDYDGVRWVFNADVKNDTL